VADLYCILVTYSSFHLYQSPMTDQSSYYFVSGRCLVSFAIVFGCCRPTYAGSCQGFFSYGYFEGNRYLQSEDSCPALILIVDGIDYSFDEHHYLTAFVL